MRRTDWAPNLQPGRLFTPLRLAIGVAALGIFATIGFAHFDQLDSASRQERETREATNGLALSLERYVTLMAARSEALAALIEIVPDVSNAHLERYAERLTAGDSAHRNLALAPDDVVTFVHPATGNSSVLGTDLARLAGQSDVVRRVRREHRTVLAGPFNLKQGGFGVASRSPVMVPAADTGSPRYWGLAILVVDYDDMLSIAGAREFEERYEFGLRGRDAAGAAGEIFHGKLDIFEAPRVMQEVRVPGGSWSLVTRPRGGWDGLTATTVLTMVAGVLASLLFGLLAMRIASDRVSIHDLAMSDPLTRLPNRRHVQWQLRDSLAQLGERIQCGALILIDFDDFKPVNDLLGHRVGDEVLRIVSERMRSAISPTDFLARIGGDEFLVVLTSALPQCRAEAEATATKLLAAIAQSAVVEDHVVRIRASMGIALFPEHARDSTVLRECADRALYRAKRDGGNRALVYLKGVHDIDRASGNHAALPG